MNAAKAIWGWYVLKLNANPLVTQAISTGMDNNTGGTSFAYLPI